MEEAPTDGAAAPAGGTINGATSGERRTGIQPALRDKPSIHRVPAWFRDLNDKAYDPQFVSFGPYHHASESLRPMEKHKRTARSGFLRRANKSLVEIKRAVEDLVDDLMGSYEDLDRQWRKDQELFLNLMVLDGCFMLEVLLHGMGNPDHMYPNPATNSTTAADGNRYAEDDPIFGKKGAYMTPHIRRDMLLIENQLPLVLLKRLAQAVPREPRIDVREMVVKFLADGKLLLKRGPLNLGPFCRACFNFFSRRRLRRSPLAHTRILNAPPLPDPVVPQGQGREGIHILDVYKESMLLPGLSSGGLAPFSANQLSLFGVDFVPARTGSFRGIHFSSSGLPLFRVIDSVLRLPMLKVENDTLPKFLNLVAFERLHSGTGNEVNNYLMLMCSLVRSVQDVEHLSRKGVIVCGPGHSDETVFTMFTELAKQALPTAVDASPHTQLFQEVASHCRRPDVSYVRWFRLHKLSSFIYSFVGLYLSLLSTVATISKKCTR